MSEYGFSPEDDPFAALEREQLSAELAEKKPLLELLHNLHQVHEAAEMEVESDRSISRFLGEIVTSMHDPGEQRVWTASNPVILRDYSYREMLAQPHKHTLLGASYVGIFVRFPIVRDKHPLIASERPVPVNDILLEFVKENGESYRYLLNDNGLFAYPDAEVLDYSNSELFKQLQGDTTLPNVLKVGLPEPFLQAAPDLEPVAVQQAIFGGSKFIPRSQAA